MRKQDGSAPVDPSRFIRFGAEMLRCTQWSFLMQVGQGSCRPESGGFPDG
jgi:hypothetical protein